MLNGYSNTLNHLLTHLFTSTTGAPVQSMATLHDQNYYTLNEPQTLTFQKIYFYVYTVDY